MRRLWYALSVLLLFHPGWSEPVWRQRLRQFRQRGPSAQAAGQDRVWAHRQVAVWEPTLRCAPLVLFSHGFHGNRNQSTRLCQSLAQAGYLVVAVEHQDARRGSGQPEASMLHTEEWNESTYKDRRDDLVAVLHFMRTDPVWAPRVDWSLGVALMGHSLGGYTAFGTAGAWPSWKQQECRISAVLGLSPYLSCLRHQGQLSRLGIPAMFQSGSLDLGVKPSLLRGGLFASTSAPAYYVEFGRASHFAWTDLNEAYQEVIAHYCVAFLDRYVKGNQQADLSSRWPQVVDLRRK